MSRLESRASTLLSRKNAWRRAAPSRRSDRRPGSGRGGPSPPRPAARTPESPPDSASSGRSCRRPRLGGACQSRAAAMRWYWKACSATTAAAATTVPMTRARNSLTLSFRIRGCPRGYGRRGGGRRPGEEGKARRRAGLCRRRSPASGSRQRRRGVAPGCERRRDGASGDGRRWSPSASANPGCADEAAKTDRGMGGAGGGTTLCARRRPPLNPRANWVVGGKRTARRPGVSAMAFRATSLRRRARQTTPPRTVRPRQPSTMPDGSGDLPPSVPPPEEPPMWNEMRRSRRPGSRPARRSRCS